MSESWWICPDAEFAMRAAHELPRMSDSKIGKWATMGFADFPTERRPVKSVYRYHLEEPLLER